jgi:hypothetical protein
LPAIIRARTLSSGRHETLGSVVTQVRILLKSQQWRAAALLADSTLSRTIPTDPEENAWLAGLAGLLGRVHVAADYLARSARPTTFGAPEGGLIDVDPALAGEALRLLAYAASGEFSDSVTTIHARLLERLAPRGEHSLALRAVLIDRSQLLAFPLLGAPEGPGSMRAIERAIGANEPAVARALLDTLVSRRKGLRPGDYSGEITLLEARLRLTIGDSVGTRRLLEGYLRNLDTAGLKLIEEYPQAVALRRMLWLAGSLGDSTSRELAKHLN